MIKKKTKKATMIPPTVTACAEVRLLKESPTQQQFGYCTKSQAMMAIGAAGLIRSDRVSLRVGRRHGDFRLGQWPCFRRGLCRHPARTAAGA